MSKLSKDKPREIILDAAKEINTSKRSGPKPEKHVIEFRNEQKHGKQRNVVLIPTELLKFRKDNGRIASDVDDYESNKGVILENTEEGQNILSEFLNNKDKEKTKELKNSIKHGDQKDPAIITCDGFLINGNRRKLVLDLIYKETKDSKYQEMKVVILPGYEDDGEEGGPPTIKEIEQIENRYQLHSDGKAEYSGFDRALSIRRKIACGIDLEEQLRDDPNFVYLTEKDFKKVVNEYNDKYLLPLGCIDRYLSRLERDKCYGTVGASKDDKEGRWQAFLDYNSYVYKKLSNEKERIKLGITENEIGTIEDVAFKLIRKRTFPDLPKVHELMRNLSKFVKNKDAKKELLKLSKIEVDLPANEKIDTEGNPYTLREIDNLWNQKHQTELIKQVRKTKNLIEREKIIEKPLDLIEESLAKLNHEKMDPKTIILTEQDKAMKLLREIQNKSSQLESDIYHLQKETKNKLNNKKK